jgi:hypothetical protein
MPEHMRVDLFADACLLGIAMKAFPCALGVQPYGIFPLSDEQCRMRIVADIQILPNPGQRRVREVNLPRLIAFANDVSRLCLPINLGTIQQQCFSNTHAGNAEDFCQCAVT